MVVEYILRAAGGPSVSPLHLACIRLLPGAPIPQSWTSVCYRITARLEPLAATAALLDLRPCAAGEAPTLGGGALAQLTRMGAAACAGIGPSLLGALPPLAGALHRVIRGSRVVAVAGRVERVHWYRSLLADELQAVG